MNALFKTNAKYYGRQEHVPDIWNMPRIQQNDPKVDKPPQILKFF